MVTLKLFIGANFFPSSKYKSNEIGFSKREPHFWIYNHGQELFYKFISNFSNSEFRGAKVVKNQNGSFWGLKMTKIDFT